MHTILKYLLSHVSIVLQMLVYEFMPNGTLRDNLSGTPYIHSLSLCFIDLTIVFFVEYECK